jgi:hypothetical protein
MNQKLIKDLIKKAVAIFATCICLTNFTFAKDYELLVDLEGRWKFSIGDDENYAQITYLDSDWEEIFVPSSWEDQGYHGYNGYAWYRKSFQIPRKIKGGIVYLSLGYIDDVDEVYLNGYLVGFTGSFPPEYETAYNSYRRYPVPANLLKENADNIIAVRVYDSQLVGGIIHGDIGIYAEKELFEIEVDLSGKWKFETGDNKDWNKKDFDDTDWDEIIVPSRWETQGYRNYDGVAWYRKKFIIPNNLLNEKLVVVLGKIDDIDEAYLNGKLIGSTGKIKEDPWESNFGPEWQEFRGYYVLKDLLKSGENVLAVRVFDAFKDGGIYEGPIGIVKQEDYVKYWKKAKSKKKSIWDIIFNR